MEPDSSSILTPELFAEIRRLQFQARRLADQGVSGKYRSAFKGQGIEFDEVREYFPGDDVRAIDWKVTARSRKPFVKSYREERELTVMIAVDLSGSTKTGTRSQLRSQLIAKVGAVLTLIALRNNDKVGLVTFSDRIESFHPPRKARSSSWRILHEVLAPEVQGVGTDLTSALSFLTNVLKRPSIVFLISDFHASGFEPALSIISRKHDLTAVLVRDPSEIRLPANSGLISLADPETNRIVLLDTGEQRFLSRYEILCKKAYQRVLQTLRRYRVGILEISTDQPFMPEIKRYFDSRRVHIR